MYSAEQFNDHGADAIRLVDPTHKVEVRIVPWFGNRAYAMYVNGANILYQPNEDPRELPHGSGIPFLAPWANRIPGGGFWANGKRYSFNHSLGVLRMHPEGVAIHGLLATSRFWQVREVAADENSAWVTSTLEFARYPDFLANWPFAHDYEMTSRLSDGRLEITVTIVNRAADPMPVAVGFHPYYNIPGVPRASCTVEIPARAAVVLDKQFVATGEFIPNPLPPSVSLAGRTLDDAFYNLEPNPVLAIEGSGRRIESGFGPLYKAAIVWAPPGSEFICFEPMAAITNGINLAHEGRYNDLQSLAPGATWRESFWVRATGF